MGNPIVSVRNVVPVPVRFGVVFATNAFQKFAGFISTEYLRSGTTFLTETIGFPIFIPPYLLTKLTQIIPSKHMAGLKYIHYFFVPLAPAGAGCATSDGIIPASFKTCIEKK